MRVLRILLVMIVGLVAAVSLWSWAQRPGRVLYVGGPILTMDASNRVVDALALDGARIAAVGNESELRAWAEQNGATVVDLAGRALLPGFIDAHGHFPGEGIYAVHVDLNSPPIGDVESIDDLLARLGERAAETPDGEWIIGMGYDDTLLGEQRHPTRHDLDRASTRHPIGVLHISGHLAAVNTAALAKLEYDADTPDPEGGVIRREPGSRRPDGVLEETASNPLQPLLSPGGAGALAVFRSASDRYARAGVTTAQSGLTPRLLITILSWASRLGVIPLRMVIWSEPAAAEAILSGEFEPPESDYVRSGAVKLLADGSIQGYTGYLGLPYYVPPGDDPGYRGYPRIPRDELIETVERFHGAGLQVAVHGNGDAAIDDILDAFESAQRKHPREDARHVVIHAQMARDDQLDRMRSLGLIPSFFSLHTFYWGDRHRTIFMGPERAARMSPAGGAVERQLRFTLHADSPVVPMEPLRLVWAAVNRRTRSGFELGPEQRISPMQALRAVTIDAAWQHFEEDV
ncbi:MAG: amidohydrolase, partial [Deltaproteobacteria bacterium]|nr:amidohydrolase [Deltaproteobacteria bacterium]